jgi:ABC-type polysaccharide/polyol phosphate export permease
LPLSILKYKSLLKYLVLGELKAKYKNKALGAAWAVLDPLVLMVIYVVLIKYIFQRGGEYYPLELLTGLITYRWFSLSSLNASRALLSNSKMLQTVKFPITVLPLSKVLVNLVDLLIGFAILSTLMIWYQIIPTFHLLWLPVLLALQFIFLYGLSIVFSIIGVYFRDLLNILTFGVRVLLYMSPILYSADQIPAEYRAYYFIFSPLSSLIQSYKNVMIYGQSPTLYIFSFITLTGLIWLLALYFLKSTKNLAKDL